MEPNNNGKSNKRSTTKNKSADTQRYSDLNVTSRENDEKETIERAKDAPSSQKERADAQ